MNRSFKLLLLLATNLWFSSIVFAQKTQKALERERYELNKQINYKNKLLKETKKSKNSSLNQLSLYRKKIANRERLINTLRKETDLIDNQIIEKKNEITITEKELEAIKAEYAKMVYHASVSYTHLTLPTIYSV